MVVIQCRTRELGLFYFFCFINLNNSYRTRDEIQEVRKTRDPITGFKDRILTAGLVSEDELKVKNFHKDL